ncbi:MAG: nucleotidyltransferase domain-containing protein [Lachnospiraceae bacterium]|nr:nucleotidyltransferase domain-containing protein [Lachnospiraceae bacterium]
MISTIQEKLREIEERENVTILLAIESGSRAWGFASPDSDYDVRFIYMRPMEEYLRLDSPKDTIEWQLDEVLDINGWDLRKALIQFKKGNATLFEWSNSPVIYKRTDTWDKIYQIAKSYFSAKTGIYHYYGTARNTYETYLQDELVKYKKYFYALRPLLACKYIEEYNCPPPVLFNDLLKLDLPHELRQGIDELLEIKKVTQESDLNPQIPVIQDFIASELVKQKELADVITDDHNKDWTALNKLFCDVIREG